jgi:16S rRNA (adenine1518-N6/adenine1519-N6)-dimethyltransferase
LTLGLLEAGADVVAVEIDPVLARLLPTTVSAHVAGLSVVEGADDAPVVLRDEAGRDRLTIVLSDALEVRALPGPAPVALVANLPYNVSVPVLLTFLERFDSLERVLVMVQAEVADRLAAPPGSRTYGVPSAKAAWYASARRTATVGRTVFWPAPNVDSALVRFDRREPPVTDASREEVFAVVDTAFAQRRKMLRSALSGLAGSADAAVAAIEAAGVDPQARGEVIDIVAFARIASALAVRSDPAPLAEPGRLEP